MRGLILLLLCLERRLEWRIERGWDPKLSQALDQIIAAQEALISNGIDEE